MSDVPSSTPSSAPSAPTSSGGASSSSSAPSRSSSSGASTGSVGAASKTTTPTKAPTGATPAPAGTAPRKLSDQVAKPATQTQTPAEKVEAAKRKYQFKVDGKEWEEELDDTEIRSRLQKGLAADKRMQEAAELRKKLQDAMTYGKDNLDETVKNLFGVDMDEYMEQRLESRFKDAMMSDEERERASLQKELERYKKQETEARSRSEQEARQKYENEIWENTEKTFVGALEKMGYEHGVSKLLLPMMADLADAALDSGLELDADMLAHETNKRLRSVNGQRLKGLKGDNLLAELGDDVVKEVLRAKLNKAKLTPVESEAPAAPAAAPRKHENGVREEAKKPSLTGSQFRRRHLFGL